MMRILFLFCLLLSFSLSWIGYLTPAHAAKPPPPDARCIKELRNAKVNFKIGPSASGMRTPVTILDGRIGNIQFMHGNQIAKPHLDCNLALTLYRVYPIFSANGGISKVIAGLFYSYRMVKNTNRLSLHASGLAIDIYGLRLEDGTYISVDSDYEKGLGAGATCEGTAKTRAGRILRQLACDLDRSHFFSAILTPDSDREHKDHFHLSAWSTNEQHIRKNRTTLVEAQHYAATWVRQLPLSASPSIQRVWRVVQKRRKANLKLMHTKRR